MDNPFIYSDDNKRYHTLAYHNKHHGGKRYKAVIDAGLSCPNIDGSCGVGGCSFCSGGSGYFTMDAIVGIKEQLIKEIERIDKKVANAQITAYFQAHTNTHCSVEKLKSMLDEVMTNKRVKDISIATRPDCLETEKIQLLDNYNKIIPITIELGLQTIHDETARQFNRGYDYKVFKKTFTALKEKNINTCVHIINGLPKETKEMMLETASVVGKLAPSGVKIHLLHIIKNTRLAEDFLHGKYKAMEFDDYVDTVVRQLELLSPETVIERLTGDGDKSVLLAPLWSKDKIRVLGTIDKTLATRESYQGRVFLAE